MGSKKRMTFGKRVARRRLRHGLVVALLVSGCGDDSAPADVASDTVLTGDTVLTDDTWGADDTSVADTSVADDAAADTAVADGDTSSPGGDAAPDISEPAFVVPPASCMPGDAGAAALVRLGEVDVQANGLHLLNIVEDPGTGLLWTVGKGGLIGLSVSGDTTTQVVRFPSGQGSRTYEQVAVNGAGVAAVANRGDNTQNNNNTFAGVALIDISDLSGVTQLAAIDIDDAGAMAFHGTLLYVTRYTGSLAVFDVSAPSAPVLVTEVDGLGTPWDLQVVGDIAYIADNSMGLVTVDLSTPDAPVIGPAVPTSGGGLGIAVDDLGAEGRRVYLAAGSAGLEVFEHAGDSTPVQLAHVELGQAAVSVSVDGGVAFVTTQESVAAVDVREPANPVLLGLHPTPSWAMGVHNRAGRAWVADWNDVRIVDADVDARVPYLETSQDELYFSSDGTQTLSLTNRGGGELIISGMSSADPRVGLLVDTLTVAPGETASVLVSYAEGTGSAVDTALCIATNDPTRSTLALPIADASSGSSVLVGETAPGFVLPDLNGEFHSLADQQGHPVVLVYFATW